MRTTILTALARAISTHEEKFNTLDVPRAHVERSNHDGWTVLLFFPGATIPVVYMVDDKTCTEVRR